MVNAHYMSNVESAEEKGKKLGVLIASLNISEEERESLLSLLPHMTEAQLEELTSALEVNYLQAATKKADEKLAEDLQKADNTFQDRIQQINKQTSKELDSIA